MAGAKRRRSARHHRAFATADIHSDDMDPHEWTDYFGVEPTSLVEKGKPYRLPSGRMTDYVGGTNRWFYGTEGIVIADELSPHLAFLIEKLGLPRPDLRETIERQGLTFRFFCFWYHGDSYRPFVVDGDFDDIVRRSGGTIDVDEYDVRSMARADATITSFDGMPDIPVPPEAERVIRRALAGDLMPPAPIKSFRQH